MIGNRVRIVLDEGWQHMDGRPMQHTSITGTLHKLDAIGATVWRDNVMPEQQGKVFIPIQRIKEIVDLGRAP